MKLWLIGMGPGNGMALARKFGAAGYEVIMTARQMERLRQYEAELAALGIKSQSVAADLSDPYAFRQQAHELAAAHPDLEAMIYNASAYNPAPPSALHLDTLLADLHVNAVGAALAAQAVMPGMQARQSGFIMLTGGGSALQAPKELASLGMGKAAMRNFVFTLAQECASYGIHVCTITICGMVQPGTRFDPDLIAEQAWQLSRQMPGQWETEVVIK